MDENKTIVDITPYLDPKTNKEQEKVAVPSFHSNPIFKKILMFQNRSQKDKFSLKDLFR